MTTKKNHRFAVMWPLALLLAFGCAPKSPEERVAWLRSFYTARPVGFIVDAKPEEVMAADAPAMDEGAEGEAPAAEPVPMRQDVLIDILLQHDSPEKLPGVTLDISMVDASKVELESWRLWVDTADLPKATGRQFSHVLEDIEYEEGYAFSVEVRHPIPVEERGEYREFSEAGGG